MNNLFNMDNKFFTLMGKICDLIFLSLMWILFCLPVITIGPANTALYYVTVKVIRRERGYLFREFFKSFRLNFKRGAIIGVIFTIMFAILGFDLITAWTADTGNSSMNSVFFGIYLAITLILLSISIYVYPVLSRFDMTLRQLVKASSYMAMRHLPYTILMLVVLVASVAGTLFFLPLLFVIPAVSTLINSLLMERILKKYMPKPSETEENTSKDEWYYE